MIFALPVLAVSESIISLRELRSMQRKKPTNASTPSPLPYRTGPRR